VLANLGVRVTPTYVLKVEDARGKVVWEHKDYEQKRVVDGSVAWLMNDILKDMTDPAKDFIFGQWTNIGRVAALKTGTTDNLRDVYSVGYVPQLVTGVWMGNSNNLEMSSRDFSSAMGPGQLWRDYMKEALADTPKEDWARPANIVTASVVVAPGAFGGYGSGLQPSSLSPFSSTENFIRGTQPARQDDWFVQGCPGADGSRKVALQLKESGPETWTKYTDAWVAAANAGQHTYGRYSWNVMGSQPCPSPSPTPSPRVTFTLPPTFTPVPTPPRTPSPSPTPKKT
jgi:membrane peptidoglycan carboxypeptidase